VLTAPIRWKKWLPEFILLAGIWGSSFYFLKIAAQDIGIIPTAWFRVAIASIFLLLIVWKQKKSLQLKNNLPQILFVGTLNSGIPFVCYSFAVLSISTGLSSMLNATTPLFGALVAWLWLKEKPSAWRLMGLILGFGGATLLALSMPGGISFKAGGTGWAVLACLVATSCYALSGSYTQRNLQSIPALVTATGSQIGATLLLLIPVVVYWPDLWPSNQTIAALLLVGVFCSGVAYVLYFRLINLLGSTKALSVTYLIPVCSTWLGVVALDEVVTIWSVASAVLILIGTAMTTGLLKASYRANKPNAN